MTALNQIPNTTETFRRAEALLNLQKDYKETEKLIEADKTWFRDKANGEGLKETVPGLGIVQVNKPAEAKTTPASTVYSFSLEKFKELDPSIQKILYDKGVVAKTNVPESKGKAGTAAVNITLNV